MEGESKDERYMPMLDISDSSWNDASFSLNGEKVN